MSTFSYNHVYKDADEVMLINPGAMNSGETIAASKENEGRPIVTCLRVCMHAQQKQTQHGSNVMLMYIAINYSGLHVG